MNGFRVALCLPLLLIGNVVTGSTAGAGDRKRVVALLARYAVQIAEALRLEAMKKKPELVKTADVYGVAPRPGRR